MSDLTREPGLIAGATGRQEGEFPYDPRLQIALDFEPSIDLDFGRIGFRFLGSHAGGLLTTDEVRVEINRNGGRRYLLSPATIVVSQPELDLFDKAQAMRTEDGTEHPMVALMRERIAQRAAQAQAALASYLESDEPQG